MYEDTLPRLESHRLQHVLGQKLLEKVAKAETGQALDRFPKSYSAQGKPLYAGFPCNVSHTRGLVACVVGQGAVGIDCEHLRPFRWATARRICSETELAAVETQGAAAFFSLWCFKEAFVKMLGCGLRHPLKRVCRVGENAVHLAFPNLRVFETRVEAYFLCAIENAGSQEVSQIQFTKVDLLS